MTRLTARFELEVTVPCLIEVQDQKVSSKINVVVNEFEVAIAFVPAQHWAMQEVNATLWTTNLEQLVLEVTRDEPDAPPVVIVREDGMRDLVPQCEYLDQKLPVYKDVAHECANRVLSYFRDHVNTPSVELYPRWIHALSSPKWFDGSGKELRGGRLAFAQPVPGTRGEMGVKKLSPEKLSDLTAFISCPSEPSIEQILISDARTAWFKGNLRRTILELAICAEVIVKRRFFAASSPAGAAFDYLEDRARISVRVLELVNAVAKEAFGKSFKDASSDDYRNLDHLFRCRNKIAHRGEISYRDDSGLVIIPNDELVKDWWHSVDRLRGWLQELA